MIDANRHRLNIRVIRVTLEAALRQASSPQVAREAVARAVQLLEGVHRDATSAEVRAEIESTRAEMAAFSAQSNRHSGGRR